MWQTERSICVSCATQSTYTSLRTKEPTHVCIMAANTGKMVGFCFNLCCTHRPHGITFTFIHSNVSVLCARVATNNLFQLIFYAAHSHQTRKYVFWLWICFIFLRFLFVSSLCSPSSATSNSLVDTHFVLSSCMNGCVFQCCRSIPCTIIQPYFWFLCVVERDAALATLM